MYAYAKTGNLAALEEFISGAHQANLGQASSPAFAACLRLCLTSTSCTLVPPYCKAACSFPCVASTCCPTLQQHSAWARSSQGPCKLQVGESCFEEGLYEAARVIFTHMPSWGRLASTLVRLHQFQAAVDAARKANSPKTWKEVRSQLLVQSALLLPRTARASASCRTADQAVPSETSAHACAAGGQQAGSRHLRACQPYAV